MKGLATGDAENLIVEVTSKVTSMIHRSKYNNNPMCKPSFHAFIRKQTRLVKKVKKV